MNDKIKKLTFWHNPTTLGKVGGPRWDCEIVYQDGTRERHIKIKKKKAGELVGQSIPDSEE